MHLIRVTTSLNSQTQIRRSVDIAIESELWHVTADEEVYYTAFSSAHLMYHQALYTEIDNVSDFLFFFYCLVIRY